MVENKKTANSLDKDYDDIINTLFLISEFSKKAILKILKISLSEMEVKCNERIDTHFSSSK